MSENDYYLAPCPKCGKREARIFTTSREVVCTNCGYAVDIDPEDIYHLYARQWNQQVKYYVPEGDAESETFV